MHHVAIMKKSWKLIPKILSGEKTIESRWYQTRRAPWGKIQAGDKIFFKNAGEPVSARATVAKVLQYELTSVDDAIAIVQKYGKRICIVNRDPATWKPFPRYCILLFLADPTAVPPFEIEKKGFGMASAWLTVGNIHALRR